MGRRNSARGGRSMHRRLGRPAPGRKALQLCKQVEHTLVYVLSGETGDDLLRDLMVEAVVPAPNETHVMALLRPMSPGPDFDMAEVLARLDQQRSLIRQEVAASINRKYVPEISFQIVLGSPSDPPLAPPVRTAEDTSDLDASDLDEDDLLDDEADDEFAELDDDLDT